jgi:hypothetical protein
LVSKWRTHLFARLNPHQTTSIKRLHKLNFVFLEVF